MSDKPKALRLADVLERSVLAVCADAAAELRRLYAENETLRSDAVRLNWMNEHLSHAHDSERYMPLRLYWGGGSHKSIRQVVDEAIAAMGKK